MSEDRAKLNRARCAVTDCKAVAEYVIATGPEVAGVCHYHQIEWRSAQLAAYEYAGAEWIKTHCEPEKEEAKP